MTTIKITGKELKQKIKESLGVNEISDDLVKRAAQAMKVRGKETGIPQDKRVNALLDKQDQIKQQTQYRNNREKVNTINKMIDKSKYIDLKGVLSWGDEQFNYTIRAIDAIYDTQYDYLYLRINISYKSQQRDADMSDALRMNFRYNFDDDTYEFYTSDGKLDEIKIDRKLANVLAQLIQQVNPESKFKRYDFFPVIGLNERFDKIFKAIVNEIVTKH